VVLSSSENVESAVAARFSENVCRRVHAASLLSACHPIYTINYHFVFSQPKHIAGEEYGFLSACCPAIAGAAVATSSFAAIGACALAVINEFAASVATRLLFFFYHSIRLCYSLLSYPSELSFRKTSSTESSSQTIS
jgi:hypothetical protein